MSKFNYVVTANKPGGVSHAFTTSFTGADSSALNLVVARCDTFSVFAVSPDGLQKTVEVPVNGKIEFIRPLHFRGRTADSLLIITVSICIIRAHSFVYFHSQHSHRPRSLYAFWNTTFRHRAW